MKLFAATAVDFLCGVIVGALLVVASAHADEAPARPLSAIAVTQCGHALAFFVQLDATHLLRSDQKQTSIFTAQPDGKFTLDKSAPLSFEEAYKLALSAAVQTQIAAPCTTVETF